MPTSVSTAYVTFGPGHAQCHKKHVSGIRIGVCYESSIPPQFIAGVLLERMAKLPVTATVLCRGNMTSETDHMVSVMAASLAVPTTTYATANIPGVRVVTAWQRDALLVHEADVLIVYLDATATSKGGTQHILEEAVRTGLQVELWEIDAEGACHLMTGENAIRDAINDFDIRAKM